jgi:hypothetical protein
MAGPLRHAEGQGEFHAGLQGLRGEVRERDERVCARCTEERLHEGTYAMLKER